jgi:hypothetical protein
MLSYTGEVGIETLLFWYAHDLARSILPEMRILLTSLCQVTPFEKLLPQRATYVNPPTDYKTSTAASLEVNNPDQT